MKKIKHLVVDTTAFLRAANMQDIADNVYTVQEVIDEITNDRQRRKLIVLPYDLRVKDVCVESVKFITEFSKKTGDYTSLSATDIKVMALAYELEKDFVGMDHLKSEPSMQKYIKVTGIPRLNQEPDKCSNSKLSSNNKVPDECPEESNSNIMKNISAQPIPNPAVDQNVEVVIDDKYEDEPLADLFNNIALQDSSLDNLIVKVSSGESESEDTSDSDSDGSEWITPRNLAEKRQEMGFGEFEDISVEVACITSDFAMQNVLKQIGLNVTAIDGRVIRQLRTFIFRCTTCFKTTSVMTKLFCPKCGHASLKKVAVSVDDQGNQHIHINGRKPLTARGKRFSLPTPKGGQHFQYPILTEDQHLHKRFVTKLARNKTNALDPDYTAGFSPFAVKDVNSKSAILGVRANKQDVKYWMKNYSKGKKK